VGLISGSPLATVGVVSAATAGALVLLWRRWGDRLVVARAAGILLCELLAIVTMGLAVNRWGWFYPLSTGQSVHTGHILLQVASCGFSR
jgi:hypothetical protein